MRPTKLSAQVFLELPPVLSHYVDSDRNHWIESRPRDGRLALLERTGVFEDLEARAVERRQAVHLLGLERARALAFRAGFEAGRRDASRHLAAFEQNVRLALQAGPVFKQLEGRFRAEAVRFEFDLESETLYRELAMANSAEARVHRMAFEETPCEGCWHTAGYLSGHVSELVGRRVVTVETACAGFGADACRFVSRLDHEWDGIADWIRAAFRMEPLEEEFARRDALVDNAQRAARRAQRALSEMSRRLQRDLALDDLVAGSAAMAETIERARQLAASDVPVLCVGEHGTGRKTLAKAIHQSSKRGQGPFVAVDCESRAGKLLDRDIMGDTGGDALPGSAAPAIEEAEEGVLYLDEVAHLSPQAQKRLVDLLDSGPGEDGFNARVIAATQREPEQLLGEGVLREDLYYALTMNRLDLPPLRERGHDVLQLARGFLERFGKRHGRAGLAFSVEAEQALLDCAWPGNIRQLRNVVEHAAVMTSGDEPIGMAALPEDVLTARNRQSAPELSPEVIRAALRRTKNNRSHAAELLGVGRTTLWRAMKRLGIE